MVQMLIAFGGGASLLLASLVNFVTYNDYPLLRPEVGIVAGTMLAVSAAMSPFYASQRQWGKSLLDGLLAAIIVDLNTAWPIAAVLFGLLTATFGYWRKISWAGPMAVIGLVIVSTTLAGIGSSERWIIERQSQTPSPASDRPPLLHLILDEHLGVEGFGESVPDASLLKAQLQGNYVGAGFRLYGGAYSEHMHTVNAVPYILNYGTRLGSSVGMAGVKVGPADYFQDLQAAGYELTVLQSDFADLCSDNVVHRCITYNSSSLRPTLAVPLRTAERSELLAWKLLALSDLVRGTIIKIAELGSLLGADGEAMKRTSDNGPRSSTAAALVALDLLSAQLRDAKPGEAFVAHILAPHEPYMVGSDCQFLPKAYWGYRHTPISMAVRQQLYRNQVRCVMKRVNYAVEALERSRAGRNAIIVIHGDHGSRITDIDTNLRNIGRFGDDELVATFSTLFAVKGPDISAGYEVQREPVSALLHEFASSDFQVAPAPDPANIKGIYLDDLDWVVRKRIPLPRSWSTESRPAMKPVDSLP